MFQAQIGLIRKLRVSAVLAGTFLFLIFGLAIFPVASSVDDTQAASRQSETTLTLSTEDLDLAFEINAINGSFAEATANVSVTTNNYTGYTLNIITGNTGTDAGKLVGAHSSFNTISSATAGADFAADAATEMNGLWGYKPSKVNGEANTSYLPAPTELTTIEQTDAANADANTYTIGLGARADLSYEAGAYVNTFIITSVANPVGYTITYNKNTTDEVTNMPEDQDGSTSDTTITLASDVPVREGIDFAGWCDGTANGVNCSGTIYQPGDDYDIDQTASNLKILYALWGHIMTFDKAYAAESKVKDTTSDKYTLQDMTPTICDAVTDGQVGQLVDLRDGTVYSVIKALDHRCWLQDNLALDIADSTVQATMLQNPSYTNANTTVLSALLNGGEYDPDDPASVGLAQTGVISVPVDYVQWGYNRPLIRAYLKDDVNSSDNIESLRTSKYGIFYNYCAASAGSYCYDRQAGVDKPNTAIDTEYDICPAGWRMPTGSSYDTTDRPDGGEYQTLYTAYNDYTDYRVELRFPLSGIFIDGSHYNDFNGDSGWLWSSTYSTSFHYSNYTDTNTVLDDSGKGRGSSIPMRCINKTGIEPETSPDETSFRKAFIDANKTKDSTSGKYVMQDIDASICSAVTIGHQTKLVDNRDGKTYTVSKENDGKCWMTQNLSFALSTSKTLSHADTDIGWTSDDATATWTPTNNTSSYTGTGTSHNQTVYYVNWTGTNTAPDSAYYYNDYLYNWSAAIASNDSSWITDSYSVAPDSICPAGWRLPKGITGESQTEEDASEWNKLLVAQGIINGWAKSNDRFNHDGMNITLGGGVVQTDDYPSRWVIFGNGSSGAYWTSSSSGSGAYVLGVNTSTVQPAAQRYRYYGSSIRCLARDGNEPIVTTSFDEAYARANKTKDTTSDKYKLSDMSTSICSAVTAGQTGQLVDVRDGTVYNVGKLADGHCWTLDNLALDLTDSTVQSNMSSSNTNANTTSLNALFGTTVRDASTDPDGNLATAGVADWASGYSYSAPLINKASKDLVNSSDSIEAIRESKYGIYYNNCAASAGSYCYGNGTSYGTSYDKSDTLIDAEYDICPAGWRMPTSTSNGEYQALYSAYNSDGTNFRTALLAPLSGDYDNGSALNQGSYGYFWSSTRYSDSNMYRLIVISDSVNPSGSFHRSYGLSVRCIAR